MPQGQKQIDEVNLFTKWFELMLIRTKPTMRNKNIKIRIVVAYWLPVGASSKIMFYGILESINVKNSLI